MYIMVTIISLGSVIYVLYLLLSFCSAFIYSFPYSPFLPYTALSPLLRVKMCLFAVVCCWVGGVAPPVFERSEPRAILNYVVEGNSGESNVPMSLRC